MIAQCVKAEMLAANSWRVAVNAGSDSADRLMAQLKTLEDIRSSLLARMPGGIGARFDRACRRSGLPDSVIAALLGVTTEEMGYPQPGTRTARGCCGVRRFVEAES